MNITLNIDGHTVNTFPADMLLSVVWDLDPDIADHRVALAKLASHYDYDVRTAIAGKDDLPQDIYHQLASDTCTDVVSQLLGNRSFQRCAGFDLCTRIAARDPRLAFELAGVLDDLDVEIQKSVGLWLIDTGDVKAKLCLAGSSGIPVALLQVLAQDANEDIAALAQVTLDGVMDMVDDEDEDDIEDEVEYDESDDLDDDDEDDEGEDEEVNRPGLQG